jgi:hypothetical protein
VTVTAAPQENSSRSLANSVYRLPVNLLRY